MTPPDPKTPAGEALSDARAREVLQTVRGSALWLTDADAIAAMLAFAKEVTPPASEAAASGAGFVLVPVDVDSAPNGLAMLVAGKRSLFSCSEDPKFEDARKCYASMIAAAPKVASEAAGLRERIAQIIDPREWDEAEAYRVRADQWFEKGRTTPGDCLTDGYRTKADKMQASLLAKADAILAALAASPSESATRADHAQGGGEDPRIAFYAESVVANDVLPTTQVVGINGFLRAVARLATPGGDALEQAERRGAELTIAYHVAICSPKGVVPDDRFYDPTIAAQIQASLDALSPARDGAGS